MLLWIRKKNKKRLRSISQYKKWRIYPYLFRDLTVFVWKWHASSRFKITGPQIYNKKQEFKNAIIWIEILQLHRYIISAITWTLNALSERQMRLLKALSHSGLSTAFRYLKTMMWLTHINPVTCEKSKYFFLGYTHLMIY